MPKYPKKKNRGGFKYQIGGTNNIRFGGNREWDFQVEVNLAE
jgi:hypothetical protein